MVFHCIVITYFVVLDSAIALSSVPMMDNWRLHNYTYAWQTRRHIQTICHTACTGKRYCQMKEIPLIRMSLCKLWTYYTMCTLQDMDLNQESVMDVQRDKGNTICHVQIRDRT